MRTIISIVPVLYLLAVDAHAQIACNVSDDLCTGDPCVIGDVEVASPCELDFGSRALVVQGRVRVPQNGVLSFTAGTITIPAGGQIDANHRESGGNLADVSLAADGAITISGSVGVAGLQTAGTITVEAAGALAVDGSVIATASKSEGLSGGTLVLRGAAGVTLEGNVDVRAEHAGSIEVSSSGGDVTVSRKLRASASSQGGAITVHAGGSVLLDADFAVSAYEAGSIDVTSDSGPVTVNRRLRAGGWGDPGHVSVSSGGDLTVMGDVSARGQTSYPFAIALLAEGHIVTGPSTLLDARGGPKTIRIEGASAAIAGKLRADGQSDPRGGTIVVKALAGDLTLTGRLSAKGAPVKFYTPRGGIIEASASNDLTASGTFRAPPGGCIAFSAGGTLDTTGSVIDPPLVPDCPGSPSGAFLD